MSLSEAYKNRRSPSAELMGSEFIGFDPESGEVTVNYTPPPSFASPRGAVQGGLIGGFLDEVMGAALLAVSGGKSLPLNLDMNISFLRMVPMETITAKGRVVRVGRRVAFLEGELLDSRGTLLARATSTALPTEVPAKRPEEITTDTSADTSADISAENPADTSLEETSPPNVQGAAQTAQSVRTAQTARPGKAKAAKQDSGQ